MGVAIAPSSLPLLGSRPAAGASRTILLSISKRTGTGYCNTDRGVCLEGSILLSQRVRCCDPPIGAKLALGISRKPIELIAHFLRARIADNSQIKRLSQVNVRQHHECRADRRAILQ